MHVKINIYLLYKHYKIANFQIRHSILFSMFNRLPTELLEVMQLTIVFSGLFGTILILLFTADKTKNKNLYIKKAR